MITPIFNFPRPEEKLLLYCARNSLTLGDKERAGILLEADLNWPYLVQIAKVHGVGSLADLVEAHLKELKKKDMLPRGK